MPNDKEATNQSIRPTKKQRELLEFIANFIAEHGYSPSYREIMRGCNYNSVATVALHVNSLISRGHLRKRDGSARSLEVVAFVENKPAQIKEVQENDAKWLIMLVDARFKIIEESKEINSRDIDALYVLVGALRVMGLDGAVQSFLPRLNALNPNS
jgi:SOS-response transcriptional repressor LexA